MQTLSNRISLFVLYSSSFLFFGFGYKARAWYFQLLSYLKTFGYKRTDCPLPLCPRHGVHAVRQARITSIPNCFPPWKTLSLYTGTSHTNRISYIPATAGPLLTNSANPCESWWWGEGCYIVPFHPISFHLLFHVPPLSRPESRMMFDTLSWPDSTSLHWSVYTIVSSIILCKGLFHNPPFENTFWKNWFPCLKQYLRNRYQIWQGTKRWIRKLDPNESYHDINTDTLCLTQTKTPQRLLFIHLWLLIHLFQIVLLTKFLCTYSMM